MRVVPLAPAPNQFFSMTLDGVRWALALKTARGCMCADVIRDGAPLLHGVRVLAGEPLLPYAYRQTGNFLLLTSGGDLPDWRVFGVSQSLVYLSSAEIEQIDAPTAPEIVPFVPSYLLDDNGFYLTTDAGALLAND